MLMVHCKSKEDDLGAHFVPVNNEYQWRFRRNLVKETLYWCHLVATNNRASTFDVFNNHLKNYEVSNNLYWKVKDDGIYVSTIDNTSRYQDFLVYHWN
ncbi:S-protein homolog 5 [Linum perenne]